MANTKKDVVENVEEKEVKAKKTTTKKSTSTKAKTTTKKVKEEKETTTSKKTEKKTTTKRTKKVATTEEAVATNKEAPVAKKETTKKEEAVEVKKEVKPTVTEAKASALTLKITPRKCRLSCDLVRGKNCDDALAILANTHHKSASLVAKVIKSAMANATNNFNMNEEKLYVASIMASDSIKMKRYLPRAKGSASGLVKRYTNLYVVVKERM